ncbi:MAG: hypothetical protein LBC74_15345 [Planctomycetaceae bacterium]|jgi:hypothetical protein|nr:hypothetical protein [Planctomycetaceae bacterium]
MLERFFNMPVVFQVGATSMLFFLILSLLMLWFKRGILMNVMLLFSFLSWLLFCKLPIMGWILHIVITSFVYWFLSFIMIKQYIKAMTKDQLEKEWQLYSSDFEPVLVDPLEFTWLDLDYYDTKQRELESLGFRKVHDFENLPQTRVFPEMRTFTRLLINTDRDIDADIVHIRIVKPKNILEINVDIRIVAFVSEFSDGTFLETHNTKGVNLIVNVDGIFMQMFEPDTPLEKLLNAHEEKVESICETKNVEVVVFHTDQELSASGEREFLLFRKDRQKKGGFIETENMQNRAIFNQRNEEAGTNSFLSEYAKQAEKLARKHRTTQENENT